MAEDHLLGPLMVGVSGLRLTAAERRLLQHPLIGGVILFSRNVESPGQVRSLTAEIHELRSPSLLVAVDQEGGRVQRCREGFTRLPPARAFGQRYDRAAEDGLAHARAGGLIMATELRRVGIDLSFAPVLDLELGMSSVIGDRAFHAEPGVVAALAEAWIDGMRAGGMPCTGKHFPGHGGVIADSHLDLPVDQRPFEAIERQDMAPYRHLIERRRLDAVMTAHIVYPALDGRPASFSRVWMQHVLRRQLGFTGLIVADDLGMQGAAAVGGLAQRAALALEHGADMVMVCNELDAIPELLASMSVAESTASAGRRMALRNAVGSPPGADQEGLARALLREQ